MTISLTAIRETPMSELNTTPLIDVMLVLLIMFIITLPAPSHAVKIDLPVCRDEACKHQIPPPNPVVNTIYIAPNRAIIWDGNTQLSEAELVEELKATVNMVPQPELRIQPDPEAPHDTVTRVVRATKVAGVLRMGFVGNESYANF